MAAIRRKNHDLYRFGHAFRRREYRIKVYVSDEAGNVGYITFKIKIVEVYVPSLNVRGLTPGRKATVLKRCLGPQCTDEYIEETVIGEEVMTEPRR